ncbi:unnamed protein product, partial [Musa textilis]
EISRSDEEDEGALAYSSIGGHNFLRPPPPCCGRQCDAAMGGQLLPCHSWSPGVAMHAGRTITSHRWCNAALRSHLRTSGCSLCTGGYCPTQ